MELKVATWEAICDEVISVKVEEFPFLMISWEKLQLMKGAFH